jgi:hypothetical protein
LLQAHPLRVNSRPTTEASCFRQPLRGPLEAPTLSVLLHTYDKTRCTVTHQSRVHPHSGVLHGGAASFHTVLMMMMTLC